MSDLSAVQELLEKDCFCHDSELSYMFECMPASIVHRKLTNDCEASYCYHKQENEIKETLQRFKTFLETKSQFKIGDKVELNYTPVINEKEAWGWLSDRHFLIKGAQATVVEVSYHDNEFGYLLQFDNDNSWIDGKDVIHPNDDPNHRSNFFFRENRLSKVGNYTACEFLRKLWSDFYKIGD